MTETNEEKRKRFDREMKALGTNNRIQRAADAIERGDHLYYIVKSGTNVRHSVDGNPVIFTSLEAVVAYDARVANDDALTLMEVSEYNEMFGRFMANGGE